MCQVCALNHFIPKNNIKCCIQQYGNLECLYRQDNGDQLTSADFTPAVFVDDEKGSLVAETCKHLLTGGTKPHGHLLTGTGRLYTPIGAWSYRIRLPSISKIEPRVFNLINPDFLRA